MKVIIAGSRTIINRKMVFTILDGYDGIIDIDEVVSGTANGIDIIGEEWAATRNIRVKRFPADWNQHGASAGPIRNQEMAKYAQACIVIWDGKSKGSADMIRKALTHELRLFVYTVPESVC